MSRPFVYNPTTSHGDFLHVQSTPYNYPPQSVTPFIPDTTPYPPSPYLANPASLPGSPHLGTSLPLGSHYPRRHSFGSAADASYSWQCLYPDQHRYPVVQPAHLNPPSPSSFVTFASLPSPPPPLHQIQINPWINASVPRSNFIFDLANSSLLPLYLYPTSGPLQPPAVSPLRTEDLYQLATNPPLVRLRITSELIPLWSTELSFHHSLRGPRPISLMDVLSTLHAAMHQQISHEDWAHLSVEQEEAVARAYTRRCKKGCMGHTTVSLSMEERERERRNGVKRVDFLLGKTRLLGLLMIGVGEDGTAEMRMVVSGW